jgi:predicted RNA methylase
MSMIPADIADRMIMLARREALWRGVLIGFGCGAVVAVLLIRGLLA